MPQLENILDQYVSHIPDKTSTYIVVKRNIVYNYIVKNDPSRADLLDFIELLYEKDHETISQILERCRSKNSTNT